MAANSNAVRDLELEEPWTFYAHTTGANYAQTCVPLAEAHTVGEFWNAFNNIPAEHVVHGHVAIGGTRVVGLSLFRCGCKPEWEDPRNVSGRSYVCRASGAVGPASGWRDLCMAAVGETVSCNGVRVVVKPMHAHSTRFEVWTESPSDAAPGAVAAAAGGSPADVRVTEHQLRAASAQQRPPRERRRR